MGCCFRLMRALMPACNGLRRRMPPLLSGLPKSNTKMFSEFNFESYWKCSSQLTLSDSRRLQKGGTDMHLSPGFLSSQTELWYFPPSSHCLTMVLKACMALAPTQLMSLSLHTPSTSQCSEGYCSLDLEHSNIFTFNSFPPFPFLGYCLLAL